MAKTLYPSSPIFKVNRFSPELVVPAKPTPHEFKSLSDLDNPLRVQAPVMFIYPHSPLMNGVDLVKLIKNAISRALVYYYPLAGRLREDPSGKLSVECTGEGVLFIEADADVTLDQFGHPIAPPFLCFDQFVAGIPGFNEILNCPLIIIQMTRLKCGGIIIGVRVNHCMCDAAGSVQFMSAIAEMAKGATSLSVLPTWERHIFNSNSSSSQQWRSPVTANENLDVSDVCHRSFILGKTEVSALRTHVFHDFEGCSSFEILVACVWKCRVLALASHATEDDSINLIWPINLRKTSNNIKVPIGYYGNALAYAVVKSTVKEIIQGPLASVLQLVRNCKEISPMIPIESASFDTSIKGYMVSDLRNFGFEKVDFGWGEAVFAGTPLSFPNNGTHYSIHDKNGERRIVVTICLPSKPMETFEQELNNILGGLPLGCVDYSVAKSKL